MIEIWKPITGWDKYLVSNLGNIKSLAKGKERILVGSNTTTRSGAKGYRTILLCTDNRRITKTLHKIILETFIGPAPSKKHEASHIDGNKDNNCVENLCWKTKLENEADKKIHGTKPYGEANGRAKLTQKEVELIRTIYSRKNLTLKNLALQFNVSTSTVGRIVKNQIWKRQGETHGNFN